VTRAERQTEAARDTLFEALLRQYPKGWIVALDANGLFVAMPPDVPIMSQQVIERHTSMLSLVEPADRIVVINAWEQAKTVGIAGVVVRIDGETGRTCDMHFVDMTHRYGVFIGLLLNFVAGFVAPPEHPNLLPRVFMARKDRMAVPLEVDPTASLVLGWTGAELFGRRSLDFIHPDDQERAISNWMELLAHPGEQRRVRFRHQHQDGRWVWLEVTNHNRLADPDHNDVLAEMIDISDEMAAQEALHASERLLRRLTEALPVGVLQIDTARRIVFTNSRLTTMLGNASATSVDQRLESVVDADRRVLLKAISAALTGSTDTEVEVAFHAQNRRIRRATVSVNSLTTEDGAVTGVLLCLADVTRDVQLRQQLEDRATYDSLTKCRNRASILDSLEDLITTRDGSGIAVMFIDLDGFKEINDRLGHAAGDQLLSRIGRRLLAAARSRDMVGRVGGDEFLLVCDGVTTAATAISIARRAAGRIRASVNLAGERVTPRASIGVAWSPARCCDADQLVSEADAAMYESKRAGAGAPVLRVLA